MSMRHGQRRRHSLPGAVFKALVGVAASVAVGSLAATAYVAVDLDQTITSRTVSLTRPDDNELQPASFDGPINMLVVGSDSGGGDAQYYREGENLADVNILLHISADRKQAVAISIPRDTVMTLPACANGQHTRFNASMRHGLGCTVASAEKLTGVQIPYAALLQFNSVVKITEAIGGVPVCLAGPINDRYSGLSLPAGEHVIQGQQALAYLRSRHGVGDGSDLARIRNQQGFLSSMQRKLLGMGIKSNPGLALQLARTLLQNTNLSTSLGSLSKVLGLMQAVSQVESSNFTFIRYPTALQGNVVVPQEPQAGILNAALANDSMIELKSNVPSTYLGVEVKPAEETAAATDGAAAGGEATPAEGADGSAAAAPEATPSAVAIDGIGQRADEHACAIPNPR